MAKFIVIETKKGLKTDPSMRARQTDRHYIMSQKAIQSVFDNYFYHSLCIFCSINQLR
jgi:hypothetical protein